MTLRITFRRRIAAAESLTALYEDQIDLCDDTLEPYNVIQSRIEALKQTLGVTDEEAERLVLNHS